MRSGIDINSACPGRPGERQEGNQRLRPRLLGSWHPHCVSQQHGCRRQGRGA